MGWRHSQTADILVLTPLPEEFEAVRSMIEDGKSFIDPARKHTYWVGRIRTTRAKTLKVALRLSQKGHLATAEAVRQGMGTFSPKLLVLFGTAAGIRKVNMGDVVVATEGYSYESGKVTPEGFLANPRAITTTSNWVERANNLAGHSQWHKTWPVEDPPKVRFGPIISGDKVITDPDNEIVSRFKTHYQDGIALEMESFAFLHAARNYPHVDTLIVRGISDFMAGKEIANEAGSKQVAVANASAFLFALLREADDLASRPDFLRYLKVFSMILSVGLVGVLAARLFSPPPAAPAGSSMEKDTVWSATTPVIKQEGDKTFVKAISEPSISQPSPPLALEESIDMPKEVPSSDMPASDNPLGTAENEEVRYADVRIIVMKSSREKWRQIEVWVDGSLIKPRQGNEIFSLPQGEHSLEIRSLGHTLVKETISVSNEAGQSKTYINVD